MIHSRVSWMFFPVERSIPLPAPQRVVPFAIGQDEAVARMQAWLGRGFWRPGDLQRRALVVKLTARGKESFEAMAGEHERWVVELVGGLPPAERARLHELLGGLKRALTAD